MIDDYILRLMQIFRGSFIISTNELILEPKNNLYISLRNVTSELDVKCKLLEWCSRSAVKAIPYKRESRNKKYQDEIRENINEYLGTDFTREEMDIIYCKLGNQINHNLTLEFVKSGYDLRLLEV